MVISFKQLKEMVDAVEKKIPKYEQSDTQVVISLSELDNNNGDFGVKIVNVEGFLGKTKIEYSKKKHRVTIKQGITSNRYFEG